MLGTKCLSVFAVLALCSFAFAADEKQMSDQDFVKDAAIGGMFEVQAGKLATQKGSEQTRSFGAQMVADHGMANDELKAIAQKKGITIPSELDAKHKEKLDKLSSLNGAEFDREYIECMKKDHQEDSEKFKTASTSLQDPDLKAFAAKTLQVVERHKQHVEGMKAASANVPANSQQVANQNSQNNSTLPPNNLPPADRRLADQSQRFDTNTNRFQDNNAQNSVGANVSQSTTTQSNTNQQFSTQQQSNNQQFSNQQNSNPQFSPNQQYNDQQFSTQQQFTNEPRESVDAQYRTESTQGFQTYTDSGYGYRGGYYGDNYSGGRFYTGSRGWNSWNDCNSFSPSLDSTPRWNQRGH